jgi:hypothetical protein
MDTEEAADVVRADTWADAITHTAEGRVRLDAVDQLRGITVAMFAWWFANMDAETYQRFHPRDHKAFAWTRGKRVGSYVGATHLTYHQYGGDGTVLRSEITFVEPASFFPGPALAALAEGHALAAVVHPLDERDVPGPVPSGRFVHVALPRPYGCELRSRWWLWVGPDADLDLLTVGRLRHVHEEFAFLQEFLPGLYASAQSADGAVPCR